MTEQMQHEEVRLPGQRYGARQEGEGWYGVCDDCALTGPVLTMTAAWDDAEAHWNTAHRVTGQSLVPSRITP